VVKDQEGKEGFRGLIYRHTKTTNKETPMADRCEKCRFYFPCSRPKRTASRGELGLGECRCDPPVSHESDLFARFPLVTSDTWCGSFEAFAKAPAVTKVKIGMTHWEG
jgi:hypothetical protein